ncbi:helix-turn-helix domain-containing protein [Thermodesulfobacteriota bacterium]
MEIPSLNQRRGDILPLAKHFLYEFKRKFKKDIKEISPDAEQALMEHNWTGNVRELKNMIERGVLTSKLPALMPQDLGLDPLASGSIDSYSRSANRSTPFPPISEKGVDLDEIEKAVERYYIEEAYKMAKGNESKAAQLLNLNHHTYRYRRKKLLEG